MAMAGATTTKRGYSDRGYGRGGYYAGNGNGYYGRQGYPRSVATINPAVTAAAMEAPALSSRHCRRLLGNGIAGRGDRTLGTILGGGAGALAGRAIEPQPLLMIQRSGHRAGALAQAQLTQQPYRA